MKVLRTPDERFEKLADYPFSPNYVGGAGWGGRRRNAVPEAYAQVLVQWLRDTH